MVMIFIFDCVILQTSHLFPVKHLIFEVLLIRGEVNVDTDLLNGAESAKRGLNNKSNFMYVQHYATIYFIIK